MKLLGAILAGGRARRFGSDKALAPIDGRPMLAWVADALGGQCDGLVVAGRDWPGIMRVDDRPRPGLGPLGGLAGALLHAAEQGYDAVLSAGCDLPALPGDLRIRLEPANAVVKGQPTIGLWRAALGPMLVAWLERTDDRSIRGWAAATDARRVELPEDLANINTRADWAAFRLPSADRRSSR